MARRRRRSLGRKLINTTGEHYLGWSLWQMLVSLYRLFR
jgi:hypothetical protein